MKLVKFLITWLRRLPWKFTTSFIVMLFLWLIMVSSMLEFFELRTLSDAILQHLLPSFLVGGEGLAGYILAPIPVFFEGLIAILILFAGVLLSYNVAGLIHRSFPDRNEVYIHDPISPIVGTEKILENFIQERGLKDLRIGIILSGGGAKGAYQAGAIKAIYEFLESNGALDKVKMIAGTSIGSWNAMFWMAGLIKSPGDSKMSAHESWWKSVRIQKIIQFASYFPLRKNYFLLSTPWQDCFNAMFLNVDDVRNHLHDTLFMHPRDGLHFYLTRSNIELGRLEFATNNVNLPTMRRDKLRADQKVGTEPMVPSSDYELIEPKNGPDVMERLKVAVFCSMDLPPLFPYTSINNEWFEDGGVVDNLPLRFGTEIERCNLLFVLALNASFQEPINQTSVTRRLYRVMDIRQGVLERDSMKLARLYNEKAKLRQPESPELVSVFAICPNQPLAVGTAEFWKTR
ncbi:hypothetical protein GWO43_04910, partial [candidate division KSB1 bacterium]|nr:hypothetical protein [candidate division KSB1 bacterium]NIR71424.1 hypothetical protein [candidate division KSB1 bacterium]NIS23345.1 hypothetical protein [candidate division KSB1 bacterium]NIT70236.1 hypothetical protein [candidate division KSB1 bacterium]NIU23959.1 hypothetical protein [candidate division KSB1 bacterium]